MALKDYYEANVPCKSKLKHGIGKFIRQRCHVSPCQDMALISFIRQGYHLRPCQDIVMVSFLKKHTRKVLYKTMSGTWHRHQVKRSHVRPYLGYGIGIMRRSHFCKDNSRNADVRVQKSHYRHHFRITI
ncbi:required for respiratory growth 1, mitochondrial [Gossypium australe]|uniref:Required for respiratory growth 1, mitochondrial n=1 Tax=Gossypium australe TaxID=47621 RepID=A0A5B6V4R9_9ROSI|nr:required for respiratory growth 1, mitochondrial [Gossypium australe]